MKLRRLGIKDLYPLLKIWKEYKGKAFNESLSTDILIGGLSMSRVQIWGIEERKFFSGFITFCPSRSDDGEDEILIDNLFVKPCKGITDIEEKLINIAFEEAKKMGIKRVSFRCTNRHKDVSSRLDFKESSRILVKEV